MLILGGILAISMPHPAAPVGIAIMVVFAGIFSGAIPPEKMLRRFMMAVPLLGILMIFQTIFSWQDDTSAILFSIGAFSLTNNELLRSISLLCRLVALISLIVLYTAISTTGESLAALQKGLSPLSRLGVPVSDISLAIGITMRFVPVLASEAERIITAQLSRGAKGRLRSALSMIIPLFLRSLERSLKVAQAMVLRLYRVSQHGIRSKQ
jgi:energy-coupling factor transport system permease protein